MDINTPADKIRAATGCDTSTPPFSVTAAALMDCRTGQYTGVRSNPVVTYTANGALPIVHGICTLTKAGVAAMTIATPAISDDGKEITVVSGNASAHTVTSASAFGGTAKTIATFGAATGNFVTLRALGGAWYVVGQHGITLS